MFIFSQSQEAADSPAADFVEPDYYDHGGLAEPGSVTRLTGGYFRNRAIPQGGSYNAISAPIPKTSLVLLMILDSDGKIVSQSYSRWDQAAKKEKILLRKAKRSIFIGVPHRILSSPVPRQSDQLQEDPEVAP